ncbi:thioredoxin [Acinetobacter phage vB_AbaM_ME3]|uniref:Thioredoxin n=1 Tax=Acinetobacter phage vB_AbaM_ME3 TaxID=1837876 RepID=A0A172Q0T0_9CAUD|nr:thioredoxin [Acinetobacter phage vB_AbaM_ME3]AND75393.1 thioredoxin [Acinetobacter phage vB_AbaM_ME3]
MSIIEIQSSEQYKSDVLTNTQKSIVKISTSTCAPCKALAPLFNKLSQETEGVSFFSLTPETDDLQNLAKELNITTVPTMLVYENGVVTNTVRGMAPLAVLKERLGV